MKKSKKLFLALSLVKDKVPYFILSFVNRIMNSGILPRKIFFGGKWRACFCATDDLSLTPSADHFRSREIGFFYRVNCAKRTIGWYAVANKLFGTTSSRATWMTMWSGFPLNLHYLFSNCLLCRHQQENWTKDFLDCWCLGRKVARVIALICQKTFFQSFFSHFLYFVQFCGLVAGATLTSMMSFMKFELDFDE